jgi:hypothetical protein
LRAAASWPKEFLYPRPFSTDKIDIGQQPNPVDQFTKSAGESTKTTAAQGPLEKNVWPADLTPPATQPATTIDPTTPTGPGAPGSGPSLVSDAISLVSGLNLLPPGTDTLFQSFYQTATSTVPKTTITRTAKNSISSTRRKVSSTTSTARNVQQTSNQTQLGLNTVHAPNQMMTGGGLGGGMGGLGAVGGGVGGLGGVSGGGLGGGISGGGLGGLLGGHH